MSEYQKIEYHIGKDGKITEKVIGGIGETCTQTTAEIEKALGKVEAQERLPEYYEMPDVTVVEASQSVSQW